MTLFPLLHTARKHSLLDQAELGVLLNRSQSWVSRIERGEIPIGEWEARLWFDRCGFRFEAGGLLPLTRPLDVALVGAYQGLPLHRRLRRCLTALEQAGRPLAGMPAEVALARLRRTAAARPRLELAGAIAAACWTPDIAGHPGLGQLWTVIRDPAAVRGPRLQRLGRRAVSPWVGVPPVEELIAAGWDAPAARVAAQAPAWIAQARLAAVRRLDP
jgi:hypothetical protein